MKKKQTFLEGVIEGWILMIRLLRYRQMLVNRAKSIRNSTPQKLIDDPLNKVVLEDRKKDQVLSRLKREGCIVEISNIDPAGVYTYTFLYRGYRESRKHYYTMNSDILLEVGSQMIAKYINQPRFINDLSDLLNHLDDPKIKDLYDNILLKSQNKGYSFNIVNKNVFQLISPDGQFEYFNIQDSHYALVTDWILNRIYNWDPKPLPVVNYLQLGSVTLAVSKRMQTLIDNIAAKGHYHVNYYTDASRVQIVLRNKYTEEALYHYNAAAITEQGMYHGLLNLYNYINSL